MRLEIIRTAGGERGKTYKEEEGKKNKIKKGYIKGNEKPIENARILTVRGRI